MHKMNKYNNYIYGMKVHISTPNRVNKQLLSTKVSVSDEFRSEFNNWLFDFFGGEYKESVKDGEIIQYDDSLIMNQKTFDTVKNVINNI